MKQYHSRINELLKPGILGFYSSCEVTVCCAIDRNDSAYNIFTILALEERPINSDKPIYLTKKNEPCGNGMNLAVLRYQITLEHLLGVCQAIESDGNCFETPTGFLTLSNLEPTPPIFVPSDSTMILPLNRILKNNFRGGSLLFEYFDSEKRIIDLIGQENVKKVALKIREIIPIDLFTISDRTGNVIIQLPEQIAYCQLGGSEDGIDCTIKFDERITKRDDYLLTIFTDHDHALMGYEANRGENGEDISLTIQDSGGPFTIMVTDLKHNIPILHQTTSMIRGVNGVLNIIGNLDDIRTIQLPDGAEKQITLNSHELIHIEKPALPWEGAFQRRKYQKRMTELEKRREFIQYAKHGDERKRALQDIRALMNVGPKTEVYLWDPFLTANDLLETWYYTTTYGLKLKVISSKGKAEKERLALNEWISKQRDTLRAGSNQLGINVDWRCQHGQYGYQFHDRFLMTVSQTEEPKAWSLGKSVNSLGKSHHILQAVSNPGHVVDAFSELWNMLEDESCLVWNSEHERKHNG